MGDKIVLKSLAKEASHKTLVVHDENLLAPSLAKVSALPLKAPPHVVGVCDFNTLLSFSYFMNF